MTHKCTQLKTLITSKELSFIMEAHNGLSALLAEEAGFKGLWGSSLSISASYGVRDTNEASWTQIMDTLEFMSDATTVPILLDADTGYGNFNNTRRLIRKCEQRDIGGICIEDKLFPKSNSLLEGQAQPLADIDEFSGKIKACKDAAHHPDFVVAARVEAFIAGWGLGEALKRAEAYRQAGADAILMHSKESTSVEIDAFMNEWNNRSPVIVVPTKYYTTPTDHFRDLGVNLVIWANHSIRSTVNAIRHTTQQIFKDESLINVETKMITVKELFSLVHMDELKEAEKKYLPQNDSNTNAIILAASRGNSLGNLTEDVPKTLLKIQNTTILDHQINLFNEKKIKDITVVRGYKKDMINHTSINTVDNDEHENSADLYSLYLAKDHLKGTSVISYGDILFKSYAFDHLLQTKGSIKILVDASDIDGNDGDFVTCSEPYSNDFLHTDVTLNNMLVGDSSNAHGRWMGMIIADEDGTALITSTMDDMANAGSIKGLSVTDLLKELCTRTAINVAYIKGGWIGVNETQDYEAAKIFSC